MEGSYKKGTSSNKTNSSPKTSLVKAARAEKVTPAVDNSRSATIRIPRDQLDKPEEKRSYFLPSQSVKISCYLLDQDTLYIDQASL
jgi:hypothetical protein